jgi:leucyl-tRNA synthetase
MTLIGAGYDWSREIDSSDPEYYRWTQYFFLLLYRDGLAYRDANWQWWCPTCQTTLSSHEVVGGVCWRGHSGVTRREIPAWYFKITAYADALLEGLDRVDWPEKIKAMQRNWIGRSPGVEIEFLVEGKGFSIPVFTTRPDTLYGATFFLLAPEHALVSELTTEAQRLEVEAYQAQAAQRSEVERMLEDREKTGAFTGSYVTNPLSKKRLPVWIADYVLPGYGSGAVMGVPAHDARDFEFSRKYSLPVQVVIAPDREVSPEGLLDGQAYTGGGYLVNSDAYNGLSSQEAAQRIASDLETAGRGRGKVQYRMRDWLISRQRYWGTPIPIVYCAECGTVPVAEDQLPVLLPEMVDFQPDGSGRSPLRRIPEFVHTTCPQCGGSAERETDTMGGFACSSWYFLRFTSPHFRRGPFEPGAMRYWMPVDLYVGGAEHAVLHLLYARFWTKVMCDAGLIPFDEPFSKLMSQGQMMGTDGVRMSKSRGNVVTPDSVVESYGADALRIYELFMAPFEQDVDWTTEGISGAWRFLNRIWHLYAATYQASTAAQEQDEKLERSLHRTIQQVSERLQSWRFNTMVSALMEFANELDAIQRRGDWRTKTFHQALDALLVLLAPSAPHIAEEMWKRSGHAGSIHAQNWPEWDDELARSETVEVAVQIDGRVRTVIMVPAGAERSDVEQAAFAQGKVKQHLEGAEVVRSVYVPGKILNLITRRQ